MQQLCKEDATRPSFQRRKVRATATSRKPVAKITWLVNGLCAFVTRPSYGPRPTLLYDKDRLLHWENWGSIQPWESPLCQAQPQSSMMIITCWNGGRRCACRVGYLHIRGLTAVHLVGVACVFPSRTSVCFLSRHIPQKLHCATPSITPDTLGPGLPSEDQAKHKFPGPVSLLTDAACT